MADKKTVQSVEHVVTNVTLESDPGVNTLVSDVLPSLND
jgi:hypothetical protein